MKEATIFLYQILHQHFDDKLKSLLDSNEHLKYLKENKYFSVKALSYPKDIDQIYPIRNFNLEIGYPNRVEIEAGKMFTYSAYVTRCCWCNNNKIYFIYNIGWK